MLRSIPKSWVVYLQSFRIFVEIGILYTFLSGILPESASFEGYNFDILMGISAPFVGRFVYNNIDKNKSLAKAWNILGIIMIMLVAVIVMTSFYLHEAWGASESLVDLKFLSMPYLLLPGFLAPLGIFLHIFSLIQLRHVKKQ